MTRPPRDSASVAGDRFEHVGQGLDVFGDAVAVVLDATHTSCVLMLTSEVSVLWTGHMVAIWRSRVR